jgi:hypothetical protein
MRFGEVIQALMAGGGNAVRRDEWCGAFLRVTQLEELSLSPGDLFATDWDVVRLDPRTGEVAK